MINRASAALSALTVCGVLLTGCVAGTPDSPSAASPDTRESSPRTSSQVDSPSADVACGQVNALTAIMVRSDWEHANGITDATEHDAILQALLDAWGQLPIGENELTGELRIAQRESSRGVDADATAFRIALDDALKACADAGASTPFPDGLELEP